jgi:hypothetical protein
MAVLAALGLAALVAAGGCGPAPSLFLRNDPLPPPVPRPRPADNFRYEPIRVGAVSSGEASGAPPSSGDREVAVAPAQVAPLPAALPAAPPAWEPAVAPSPWQWIVLHHSGTRTGSAAAFDKWHRHRNHWDELGYHFVIGNGTGSGDGQVEVGTRWPKQKHGAHCRVGRDQTYNQTGIGICLVGDFQKTRPTERQMQALAELVEWLSLRFGIPEERFVGHGTVDRTTCPGRYFSVADLRRRVAVLRQARAATR